MNHYGPVKYGRSGHEPRCSCPDCAQSFVDHNRTGMCACLDCTYHREIKAPPPPIVAQPMPYPHRPMRTPAPKREEPKPVSGIHICEREGCESFIRGEALAYVDLMPNTTPGTNREVKELCPACIADIYALLKTAPLEPRDRGYSKPYDPKQSTVDDSLDSATDEQVAANLFQRMMRKAARELQSGTTKVDSED